MRILFWTLNFWPAIGGVEVLAAKLVPSLRQRGHEFVVVAPRDDADLPEEEEYHGVPIHRLSFHSNIAANGIDHLSTIKSKVADLKRAFKPDLVHINGVGYSNFFHLTTSQIYRAPLLVTLHGRWATQADSIVGHTLRAANWVSGCSAAILKRARLLVPEIMDRSSIIYNGLEAPQISPEPLPFVEPRILCLGRLSPEKGIDLALAAFPQVLQRFPRARLTIAGNGRLRSELERQAAKESISHAVDFVGWVAPDAVPSLINSSTIVLMPSRHDSLPLVALQAALMARPIVATRVGGLPEVVTHEETGLLVESENAPALSEAIELMLARPEIASRMGDAARARVKKFFSWEQHVNSYDALYRKLATPMRQSSGAR